MKHENKHLVLREMEDRNETSSLTLIKKKRKLIENALTELGLLKNIQVCFSAEGRVAVKGPAFKVVEKKRDM